MKAGLLICDHILPELEHINGQYIDMFNQLLPELELIPYYVCDGEFPKGPGEHEVFICTGSKYSVYDPHPWIKELCTFVDQIYHAEKVFIGLCYGHQMMAHALGGEVAKSNHGWCIGVHEFELNDEAEWIDPRQENFSLLMMCQDQVTKLPPRSKVFAQSNKCPVAMYTIGNRFLGVQAHPEFSKEYNRALFTSRTERIGEQVVADAITQMDKPLNTQQVVRWIMNFIKLSIR